MKLKDAMQMTENFVASRDGKILAIKHEGEDISFGKYANDSDKHEILNAEVEKTQHFKGVVEDLIVFSLK